MIKVNHLGIFVMRAFYLFFVFSYFFSSCLFANTHFTVRGTVSDSHYGLINQSNYAVSGSIEWDVGKYIRLGVTHRQAKNLAKGFYAGLTQYEYRTSTTKEIANSIDLSLILYYGSIFVPFVQMGLVKKDYLITYDDVVPTKNKVSVPPIPNGGFGIGIRLNENFSLKLTQNLSPGIKISKPYAQPEKIWDTYSSIGITYDM